MKDQSSLREETYRIKVYNTSFGDNDKIVWIGDRYFYLHVDGGSFDDPKILDIDDEALLAGQTTLAFDSYNWGDIDCWFLCSIIQNIFQKPWMVLLPALDQELEPFI